MTDTPREPATYEQTQQAQEAHGGSMAPGLVDPTGHPIAEPAPDDEPREQEVPD